MATTTANAGPSIPGFATLQRIGKSLMLPIAVLPAAGILLRLGQDDLLGQINAPIIGPFFDAMTAAGGALFDNLPLLFCVGVAIGFAKKSDGSTALAAVVGYLVLANVFKAMAPVLVASGRLAEGTSINYSVLGGIIIGLVTAVLWEKYHTISLPPYLGFFGGRRFVPIAVALASLLIAFVMAYIYPWFNTGLTGVGKFIGATGAFGAFAYGFLNRMLIMIGLHHILNSYIWFIYNPSGTTATKEDGSLVTGELSRFYAGDPTGGHLTSGFYPILMFGLPAAALAMMHVAKPGQKKAAVGILAAAGLTAFLTGVTEPLEFAFMFVAFPLYVVHALLTGLSLAIAYVLDIHLGFSFSAGLIDLVLYGTAPAAKNVPMLIGLGLVFAALYYFLFRFVITKWNLRTPGREDEAVAAAEAAALTGDTAGGAPIGGGAGGAATATAVAASSTTKAGQLIAAFGGAANLEHVDACMTRLRMEVGDVSKVNKDALKALGAAGVIEVGNNVQAIFGPQAEALKNQILEELG